MLCIVGGFFGLVGIGRGAKRGQTGYTIEMRYFLPMVRPSSEEYDSRTDYDTNLDLSKMPAGLSVGEYAFSIMRNMATSRSATQYGQKSDLLPHLKWSVLTEHVQAYGLANGWGEDGPERAVEAMLEKGAPLFGYWDADLVEWPFSGDRCLLAWTDAVVETQMLRKTKTETQREQPETEGDTCTQLGRWFAQRPELLDQAPEAVARLVQYVQTIDSMHDYAFDSFCGKHASCHVMKCDGIRGRMDNTPIFRVELARTLTRPKDTQWVEQGFRSFVLGFAWELRAQGNTTIFDKIQRVLNRAHQWLSPAQLKLCMGDELWVASVMDNGVKEATPSLVELAKRNGNHGFEAFYPNKVGYYDQREQYKLVAEKAQTNSTWSHAMYKLMLASTLREHFSAGYTGTHQSFERLLAATPLLGVMDQDARSALFEEMTQSISAVAKAAYRKDYKTENPWGMYIDAFYDAWSMQRHEDENEGSTSLGFFMEWLTAWQHPYQADLQMYSVISGDCESVGNWLTETVAQKMVAREHGSNSQNDPQILLHELLDFPMEHGVQTMPQTISQNSPPNAADNTGPSKDAEPAQKAQILLRRDFAVTHPDDYWNVDSLF